MDKKNLNLYVLSYITVIGFIGLTAMLFFIPIPAGSASSVNMIFGAWIAAFTGVMGYFFGSSKSSSDKTELIANGGTK